MELRWLGTAGFELRSDGGTVLLIDPYLSRPPSARPASPMDLTDIPRADAILVTHGHFDHALDVPALASRLNAPVYASASVCQILARPHSLRSRHSGRTLPPVGTITLHPLAPGDSIQVGNLRIRVLATYHVRFDLPLVLQTLPRLLPHLGSLRPLLREWPAGQVLGFHITAPDLSLVHLGSASRVKGSLEGLRPDVALLPVQGRSDIAQAAARMAVLLQPRLVVPHHWDDFCPPISQLIPLTPFIEALSRSLPATRVHVPEIGRWFLKTWEA